MCLFAIHDESNAYHNFGILEGFIVILVIDKDLEMMGNYDNPKIMQRYNCIVRAHHFDGIMYNDPKVLLGSVF